MTQEDPQNAHGENYSLDLIRTGNEGDSGKHPVCVLQELRTLRKDEAPSSKL